MPNDSTSPRPDAPVTGAGLIADAPVHRRAFLGWFGVGSTTAAVAATLPAATAKGVTNLLLNRGQLMLNEVTHATFAEFVSNAFQIEIETGRFAEARLAEATLLPGAQPARTTGRRAAFSLLFRLPAAPALGQRIYAIEHATLGRMELFLVPVGCDGGSLLFEAIFN